MVVRAGIFIGIDRAGDLQPLKDAADGARRMHKWAVSQGMADKTHAKLITDARRRKVHPGLIYDAIKELVDGPGVDQLIVYFAGHGLNINRSEHWLLTEAPEQPNAAVNVAGSVDLAGYCGIQHVVVISDACRVAPQGIQWQNVRGNDIFPNTGGSTRAKPVDQFFACVLGRTAAELQDPVAATGAYSALYTGALLDALGGKRLEVLEPADTPNDGAYYVRPDRLEAYLESEIPRRISALQLETKVNQEPEAFILSRDKWLSRILVQAVQQGGLAPIPSAPVNLRAVAADLIESAVEGRTALDHQLQATRTAPVAGAEQLAGTVDLVATPVGPDHFESQCGIKVRGARIAEFFAPRAHGAVFGSGRELLRIDWVDRPAAASVLLRFEGGFGAVVPAIPEFLATLTFEGRELVDVAYEPSANTPRWKFFERRAADVRALRAVAASSSQHGRFRLVGSEAEKVARQMQYIKSIDPTLAVYAAYAYHDLQLVKRIRDMSDYLRMDIRVTLFDLALLGRRLVGKSIDLNANIVPFVPLLSQGWALLRAHSIRLHPALDGIEATMRDSLWSLFTDTGVTKLREAMESGEVR